MVKKIIKKLLGDNYLMLSELVSKKKIDKKEEDSKLEFYSSIVKPGDLVFDVGANMGNRVASFLALGCKVIAVEPQESCVKVLKYKFGSRITIVQKGLGDKVESKTLHISDAHTLSSLSTEWIESVQKDRFEDKEWNKTQEIEITTLDHLINVHGSPKFIKIDVEGYEKYVLKGLSTPVSMISLEYCVPEQTKSTLDCIEIVRDLYGEKNVICNYSIGESMQWAMEDWVSVSDMVQIIESQEFSDTRFGDLYLKRKN